MNNVLSVVYSSDDKYSHFLGISMLSLFRSQTEFDKIIVYVLDCGIGPENHEKLLSLALNTNNEIYFCPLENQLEALGLNLGKKTWFIASYARLFISDVLPERTKRVLYLDCDTIIIDSLKPLWETDLNDALIAGVQDTVDEFFLKVINLPKGTKYINAGILLINLELWRKEDLKTTFRTVIERFDGTVPHHDQGIINCSCGTRRVIVPLRYNLTSNNYSFSSDTIKKIYFLDSYYSQKELESALVKPAIIHFTTGLVGRPWELNCSHPLKDAFETTAALSPWHEMKKLPDSRKKSLKLFTFVYRHIPLPVFEFFYRRLAFLLHLRK